jgi:light-regulated signal transduction histidine kinase (bacteriophytochrome)
VTEKGAAIEVGDLPVVPGDDGELRRLFQNLLENALKFTRTDAPPIRIDAERRPSCGGCACPTTASAWTPPTPSASSPCSDASTGTRSSPGRAQGSRCARRSSTATAARSTSSSGPAGGSTFVFTLRAA